MTNPFDVEDGTFHVLRNDEEQYSLWPAHIAVPDGWQAVLSDASRADCVTYVDETWTDLRPRSLREAMDQTG